MQIFNLLKDNAVIFTGTNAEVYEKLLTTQPQSTAWALQHGGYKIEPTTHKSTDHIASLRCDECGYKFYDIDANRKEYESVYHTGYCSCTLEDNG